MKLLAVNISKLVDQKETNVDIIRTATQKAWILNKSKLEKDLPYFVIGVSAGVIKGRFILVKVLEDVESNRVGFVLKECNKDEKSAIDIFTEGKRLKHFVVKYKWE
jgi:hypothetical protein